MNLVSKKNTIKILGLLFLALLFSTNYYGGNALFFLSDDALFMVRVFLGTAGVMLLILYASLCNKQKRDLIEYNGRFYSSEAINQIENYGLTKDIVELAIKNGVKKEGRLSTYYSYSDKQGISFTVILNDKGYVVEVSQ